MKKLNEVLEGVKSIALGGHVRPDGDCIGSLTACYKYINKNYPEIIVDCFIEGIPTDLEFLLPEGFKEKKYSGERYDLFIALDAADKERLDTAIEVFDKASKTVCIDHHSSNDGYADVNVIEAKTGSASEVLFELLDFDKIDKSIAMSIYTGMVHDTGVFQYSNTSSRTLNIAAELIKFGFDFSAIIEDSFYSKTFIQNKLLGYCLGKAQLELENRCIISQVSIDEYEKLGAKSSDFEGIVSQLRNTREPDIAVLLSENEPGIWKASMRSKGKVNLIPIAAENGGGGHILAAGCTLFGNEQEVYEKILKDIENNL